MFISSANALSDPQMIILFSLAHAGLTSQSQSWRQQVTSVLDDPSGAGNEKEVQRTVRRSTVTLLGWDSSDHKHFFSVDLSI